VAPGFSVRALVDDATNNPDDWLVQQNNIDLFVQGKSDFGGSF